MWKYKFIRGKKVIWEVVYNHDAGYPKENDNIELQEVGFNLFDEDEMGGVRELLSKYPCLFIIMRLCPVY